MRSRHGLDRHTHRQTRRRTLRHRSRAHRRAVRPRAVTGEYHEFRQRVTQLRRSRHADLFPCSVEMQTARKLLWFGSGWWRQLAAGEGAPPQRGLLNERDLLMHGAAPNLGVPAAGYTAPPRERNARGELRRVGLELELAGLTVESALELIKSSFGGTIECTQRTMGAVHGTPFGTFKVEFDLRALQKRSYLWPLEMMGIESDSRAAQLVEDAVIQVASEVVPVEVITPPIAWNRLHELDPLWEKLRAAGAEDTYGSVFYAFGLHLNPELPDRDPASVLAFLRAYLLLEDWVIESSSMDISRRIAPFVRPFPEPYRRRVLAPSYAPLDGAELVEDYLDANPTRNRGLDLLPLFVELFGPSLLARVEEAELVKPRPTFHYRLPNCELSAPGWSPRADWNRWIAIERLAQEPTLLNELSRAYLDTFDLPLRLQSIGWIEELRERITLPGEVRSMPEEPVA